MKHSIAIIIFTALLASCSSENTPTEQSNTVNYAASTSTILNPERGFIHTWPVYSEGTAVSVASLANLKNENVTLVLRFYYFEKFKSTPLSQTELDLITTDLGRFRDAGIKCILRFGYTDVETGTDANFATISGHLDQLKSIITANSDVIAFVQAGFIGAWGEWYYSSNNLNTAVNRKLVLDKLLTTIPSGIKIQVRTPGYKQEYFGTTTAMESTVGYGSTSIARVGFHNDSFLTGGDDAGTYTNITTDKAFISKEANYVPTGGETAPPANAIASCTEANTEMTLLKWTYLNLDYYGPVLQSWRTNSCFTDFEKKLGYRIRLVSTSVKSEIVLNSDFDFNAILFNGGYAPVYNTKNTFLIFRSVADGTVYKKKMNFDIRFAVPNLNYQINETISTSGIPSGKYELLLKIEDASSTLSARTEYCIQLANTGIWESTTGMNKLSQTVTIK